MPEFKDVTDEITKTARDAAYVVVGLGVLGFQRAQVRRQELQKRLTERNAVQGHLVDVRGEVTKRVKDVDEAVEQVIGRIEATLAPIEERLPVLDGHAAGERDRPSRTRALPGNQLAKLPEDLLLGVGPHRAGDQHGDVGVLERGFGDAADVGDMSRQLLTIGVVHLTADVPEVDARRPPEHRHLRLAARSARDQRERPETTSRVAEDRYLGHRSKPTSVFRHPSGATGRD